MWTQNSQDQFLHLFQTNSKILQFGDEKCKKLHVGHEIKEYKCQDLAVDKWSEVEIKNGC